MCGELIAEAADFFAILDGLGSGGGRRLDGGDLHQIGAGLLLEHVLAVELHHALVFPLLFEPGVARADLFLAGVLGDAWMLRKVA